MTTEACIQLSVSLDAEGVTADRLYDGVCRALLEAEKPSAFFRALENTVHLKAFLPELLACAGVPQNPVYHPEGDVFEHTMLVVDSAAALRERAHWPLGFMLSALLHDLGKAVATRIQPDGKIIAYGHEWDGLPLCERQLRRLTDDRALIDYVKNMTWLHMRPNMLAGAHSKKKKTRQMFDLSACPEDLILLSRADASGKLDAPYDERYEAFLWERLEDYRQVMARPMVTEDDLVRAGVEKALPRWIHRARDLHLSGLERDRALQQVMAEVRQGK